MPLEEDAGDGWQRWLIAAGVGGSLAVQASDSAKVCVNDDVDDGVVDNGE